MSYKPYLPGAFLAIWSVTIFSALCLDAQSDREPTMLASVVVSAERAVRPLSDVHTSIALLDAAFLERHQGWGLGETVAQVPGVNTAQNGALGASASIFIRGTNSNQTLFMVDGIRVSDANTLYGNTLGGWGPANVGQIEVVRGAQSVLYGSDAIGGVVALQSLPGRGKPVYAATVLGGSNATLGGGLRGGGESGVWAWSLETDVVRTENERPNNAFRSRRTGVRLERDLGSGWRVGTTVRFSDQVYGSPNSRFFPDPDNYETERQLLGTLFLEGGVTEEWTMRAILGHQRQRLISRDPGFDSRSDLENDRFVVDVQNVLEWGRHEWVVGYNGERSTAYSSGFGAIDSAQTLHALFIQDRFQLSEVWSIQAGLRWDEFDTFGSRLTWKLATRYELVPQRIILRSSLGTGFRAPSFIELFAKSPFFVGNPGLSPEQSVSAEIGLEWVVAEDVLRVSLTGFRNELEDLITSDFSVFPSTTINLSEARTQGLELSVAWQVDSRNHIALDYTWLEAEETGAPVRLLRRPSHSTSARYTYSVAHWEASLWGHWIVDREDIHGGNFSRIEGEDYLTVDAALLLKTFDNWTLRVSLKNVFDESYESAHGFPTLGRNWTVQVGYEF